MGYWLFGAKPSYDLEEEVPRLLDDGDFWHPAQHRKDLTEGDHVILWQHGRKAGVYGFGKLTSKAYKRGGEWRVDIEYAPLLKQPVFRRDLRKHPLLRNLGVLKVPNGHNPFSVKENEWHALNRLISKDTLNIFTGYGQEENRFTNGLVSLLELSRHSETPLTESLLTTMLDCGLKEQINTFRVLRGIDGTADAELCGSDCCIRFETKIEAGSLREDQICNHLERLERSPHTRKVLVLLTPDDGGSDYIKRILSAKGVKAFCRKGKDYKVLHLEWRRVYEFLKESVAKHDKTLIGQLVLQFRRQIHDRIFDQDFAGIIQKIAFGDWSEVYPDKYLDELRRGQWTCWNTPKEYKKLNGTGRKLLLYDRTRKAITAEVEIHKVEKKKQGGDFPWRNSFVPKTLCVYKTPIALPRILNVQGLENFTRGMAAAWNVTQEQYRQLSGGSDETKNTP